MSDFKLFIRNLIRNKFYSFVTVLGFSIALTFVIVLGVYIRQELTVDQFHVNKDRIFRAVNEKGSRFGPVLGTYFEYKYPEIECFTRLAYQKNFLEIEGQEKVVVNMMLVDSAFFRMFSFPLCEGDPASVFREKNAVVLTRSYARKLFGDTPAIGKKVMYGGDEALTVSGILEDLPGNTHFDQCDALCCFDMLAEFWGYPELLHTNNNSSFGLYMMAYPGTDLRAKAPQMLEFLKGFYWTYQNDYSKVFEFEPLTEVYWGQKEGSGTHGNNPHMLMGLSAVALIILLLAMINYNNLSVAQATTRAKEVAVKKLVGITNRDLFLQFIMESVVLCFVAFGLAFVLDWLLLPFFNRVLDTHISFNSQFTLANLLWGILIVIVLGILGGLVPAYVMSRYKPIEVVKGGFRKKVRSVYGKALICFQYVVAIVLMICTLVIIRQTGYLLHYDLGFDKENVVWMEARITPSDEDALRNEFYKIPGVAKVAFAAGTPLDGGNNNTFLYDNKTFSFQVFIVDTSFFSLFDIHVEPTGIDQEGIWLNQTAVKELGLTDLTEGFQISENRNLPVMGVTEDFHFMDLTQRIGGVMIRPKGKEDFPWSILVKIDSPDPVQTYNSLKKVYSEYIHGIPFESFFADQRIRGWYKQYERTARLIGYFSVIAFTLAMMGILAMATYFIRQRVKEIGLRRVNGARIQNILQMLVTSFMKWILIAFIIACPVAWYIMDFWLADFPFRIAQTPWIYIGVGLLTALMALLMIGWQSYKAATMNPVNALRNE